MIAAHSVEEVKDRADILTVASRFTSLKRSGVEFVGLCPYPDHDDKTPSFYVNPANGFYLCRGCGRGGDAITLVRQLSGLDFTEAVEFLADVAGIEVEYDESHSEDAAARARRREIEGGARKLMGHAAVAWCRNLLSAGEGEAGGEARLALDYLVGDRGFPVETLKEFRVGYAPDGGAPGIASDGGVKGLARSLDISDESVELSGLLSRANSTFGGRITFPITDSKGRTLGFGGRLVPGGRLQEAVDSGAFRTGKYVNSRDSKLFSKGELLYGLGKAQAGMRAKKRAVVCEGYTDVISLHQAGVTEAVATLGTATSKDHLKLLSPYCGTIYLTFDPDEAGVRAVDRAWQTCESGTDMRVVTLDSDPADWLLSHDADEFYEILSGAPGAVEFLIVTAAEKVRGADYRVRAKALEPLREMLPEVENSVVRKELERYAAKALQVSVNDVRPVSEQKRRKTRDTYLMVVNAPLYLSDQVVEYPLGQKIYLTSHTRHADALVEAGHYAVAITSGYGTCPPRAALEVLEGRKVVIWYDDTPAAACQAVEIARMLGGIAESAETYCHGVPGVTAAGAADHPAILAEGKRRSERTREEGR